MSNPLFQIFGNNKSRTANTQAPFNNPMQVLQEFNNFKTQFQGDPKQKVQEMLNNGQMSQEQFNQLSMMANTFRQFLGR